MCYSLHMNVGTRELRNNTRGLLAQVKRGETVTITVDGEPAAALVPLSSRPTWIGRDDLLARLQGRLADPGLRADLASLSPDTTDDLPLP
jgi:prevent-host-death family protein